MENSIYLERIFSIVFLSIFILAILGNILAFVIFQTNKEMRKSSTITFLSFVEANIKALESLLFSIDLISISFLSNNASIEVYLFVSKFNLK